MSTASDETLRQLVGKRLGAAARIEVAEKVGQSEHGIEHKRRPRWRRPPVWTVRREEELEFAIAKMVIENLLDREVAIGIEPHGVTAPKVVEEPVHVSFFYGCKKRVQSLYFMGKLCPQLLPVTREIGRHGKVGTIRKMELVDRIHFDPLRREAELPEKLPGHGLRIAEQRIKVRRRIKGISLAPEHTAIAANHVVLLN